MALPFYSFLIMLAAAGAILLLGLWGVWLMSRGRFDVLHAPEQKLLLTACIGTVALPYDAFVRIGYEELDIALPRRVCLRRNFVQIGLASEVRISLPGTSRHPSVLTPVVMMPATETMRPPRRTLR